MSKFNTINSSEFSVSKNKVLTNTYQLLGISLIPTVIGAFIGNSMNFSFMAQHPIISFIGYMVIAFGLFAGISANRNSGVGVALLLLFTLLSGVMLGPLLQHALHFRNGGTLLGLAGAGTALTFLTMSAIATTTKRDLSGMGKFLTVGVILLILGSLVNIFLAIPLMSLVISGLACLIFAGFMMYDVNRVVTGGETNYVMATLAIYLDIYNFFVNLVQILTAFAGDRD